MNKKTTNILRPVLRFNDFTDDWEQRKLGNISDKVTKKNQNVEVDEVFTNSAEYGIIPQRDFFDKDIANSENIDGYYVVEPDDFIYNPRISTTAPFGPINRNKLGRTGAMSPLYNVFRLNGVNHNYLELFFQTNGWHAFMRFNGNTGARSDRFAITDKVFNEMPIFMPQDIEEQKKIGQFFSHLDKILTLHQRKCDQLTTLKKYMLANMFPQEGKLIPKIRFSGFTDAWEQRKLGELSDVYDGTHQTPNYTNSGVMFLSVENIETLQSEKYISEEDFKKEFKVFPEKGDILMTRIGDIGTANVVESNETKAYYVSLALLKYKKLDPYFLKESISSKTVKKELWHRTLHIAFPKKINKNEIANVSIPYPKTEEEQHQIGVFFQNINNLITLHQRKCDSLKQVKNFLLQKMFI